ncbi:hypothetical protein CTAYLR_009590 [Chrysophaeum taylorii]|uniref:Sialidase domain-containing protein n=1 Tax=Chrysophaeum taylorii TaxID=2483200 RepID=A0AAD7XN42_9STRA|nr:hypothetical protein CTAYLR_009590 [Chrysophaeum taylorii]
MTTTRGVFSNGLANITCYRIPVVVETSLRSLLAFAEARHGSCSDSASREIAVRRSTDAGRSWGPVVFAAGPLVQNPVAATTTTSGRVVLVFASKNASGNLAGNGAAFSDDDGLSWTQRAVDFGVASGWMPGPGAAAVLGDRIVVASHRGQNQIDYSSYSDDDGETWTTSPSFLEGVNEAAIAPIEGGVMLNMRNKNAPTEGRAISRSRDGGETWDPVTFDPTLVSPVCEASLVRINGSLFSNPASATARVNLTVRRSDDDGVSWLASTLVVDADHPTATRASFPAAGKTSIDFATFALDAASWPKHQPDSSSSSSSRDALVVAVN